MHDPMNSSSRIRTNDQNVAFLEAKVDRLTNQLSKLENDRILSLQREVAMLRQLLDFQNAKLDKVTLLLTDLVTQLMHRKGKSGDDEVEMELRAQGAPPEVTEDDDESMLHSIRAFQDSVNVSDLQRHNLPLQINQNMNHLQTQQPRLIVQQSILDHNRVSMQRMQQQLTHHQNQTTVPDPLDRDLENNMDPELHHISGVVPNERQDPSSSQIQQQQTRGSRETRNDTSAKQKPRGRKRKRGGANEEVNQLLSEDQDASTNNQGQNVKPETKVHIEFIHNPTSIRDIYDEFFKGYKGQGPLCEMDAKYGKLNWRGDSRSKESKRYQRRKRICDAIKRGSYKYNKLDDEMIEYLESFRKEKSLTWVMNGNIPEDLKE